MRNIYTTILAIIATIAAGFAQNIETPLADAKSAYNSGKLDDARFALQQALNEVDIAIGQEVMKILPTKMGNLSYQSESDEVMGMGGSFAGLHINRSYGPPEGENNAKIQIMSDSPLLAGINTLLAMPMIGGGDPNQKRIRVDGYRGLLQKSEMEGNLSYEVQIPFSSSLLTFNCSGISNENEVMNMVNSIPVSKIAELIR